MLDIILQWAGVVSPVGAIIAFVTLVMTGRLIPRSTHLLMLKVQQDQMIQIVEDRKYWRDASNLKDQTITALTDSNETLTTEVAQSIHKTMTALQANLERGRNVSAPTRSAADVD